MPKPLDGETTDTEVVEDTQDTEVTETDTDTEEVTDTSSTTEEETEQEFDPVAYIDSLELEDKHKQALREGFLRQADYTQKTQEVAKVRKAAEAYEKVRPYLSRIFNDEQLFATVFQGKPLQAAPAKTPEEEVIPDDPKEYAQYILGKNQEMMEERFAKFEQTLQQREQAAQADFQRQQDYLEAEKVDTRLNSDEKFATIIAGMVSQNPQFLAGQVSAVEATKQAVKDYDAYTAGIKKTVKTDFINKAKNKPSSIARHTSGADTTASDEEAVADMRSAWKLAEAEIGSKK